MSKIIVGPLLGLETNNLYTVCLATDKSVQTARVEVGNNSAECILIRTTPTAKVWRAEFEIEVLPDSQSVSYRVQVDDDLARCKNKRNEWRFYVPAAQEEPKIAYVSCNGFSSAGIMHKTDEPYKLWQVMEERHLDTPFSLLLMGGDQIYADEIWTCVPELKKWNEFSLEKKRDKQFTRSLEQQVDRFYDQLYQSRWNNEAMSLMMAQVPSVMMWDDHDIFDGWGSYPQELHECKVFQGIFGIARSYFEAYQIRSLNNRSLLDSNGNHYAFGFKFRDYQVLALDNRGERSLDRVMGPNTQWPDLNRYLSHDVDHGHLLIMSAVPVVYRDFSFTESVFDATPWEESLTDDLKDHWRAKEHQGERARLIHRVLENVQRRNDPEENYKTIILSGDVHIGCIGVIQDRENQIKIHQVVSSGVVHPPPSRMAWYGIMAVTNDDDEYLDEDRNIHISMLRPFASDKYIRHRNFVSLYRGTDEKVWVNWESDGKDNPYYPID